MGAYAREELLACVIARLLDGARHAAVGAASPIPAMGCFLKKAASPAFRVSLQQRRKANPFSEGARELFDLAGQGRIDTFFLGGAQIDGAGAINLLRADGKRFPGSFGSAYMYPVVERVILFREEHSPRVLVRKVEFVSAAGRPAALLTGKALFGWSGDRFVLRSFHDGESVESIREQTGFDFEVAPDVAATAPPSAEDLAILRSTVAAQMSGEYPAFVRRVWPSGREAGAA